MSMYASASSRVDSLNTEDGRDPASRLTQIADKRRERATQAETDEQKQERLRKWRREIGADDLLRLPIEEMKTCQHEHLAAENTADKDARLQQISELQHKPKGYQLRVPLKETSDCSIQPKTPFKHGYIVYTSMMIIIVGASLSEQHTDLHTAGFVTRTHK